MGMKDDLGHRSPDRPPLDSRTPGVPPEFWRGVVFVLIFAGIVAAVWYLTR